MIYKPVDQDPEDTDDPTAKEYCWGIESYEDEEAYENGFPTDVDWFNSEDKRDENLRKWNRALDNNS